MTDHAKVIGKNTAANNIFREIETEVRVQNLTVNKRFSSDYIVEFDISWGKTGNRDFQLYGYEDIEAVASVLATALGLYLTDTDPDAEPEDDPYKSDR